MTDRFKFRARLKDTGKVINEFMENYTLQHLDNDSILVEQCTGLKDKNGKLIYEGDIIKLKSNYDKQGNEREKYFINEIYFSNARCCFSIKNGRYTKALSGKSGNIEIIGNIHENKELLNKER